MGKTNRRAWLLSTLALPLGCTARWPETGLFTSASLTRLAPGEEAPSTEGVDAEGKPLGTSSHRGKVVLLTFWSSTCPPCKRMFPHENELASRYSQAPFALLGVNCDPDPQAMRHTQARFGHQFPSIWDAPPAPLCTAWRVEALPTFILLDRAGKVRFRRVGEVPLSTLETAIGQLLSEGK
jgi:thiol-disulfide isomerase/thioredoxin